MEKIALEKIENEYAKWLEKTFTNAEPGNVDELIHASVTLFQEFKIKGIPADDGDNDMMLFQYGTYDWGAGRFFEFDITRQFMKPNEDEPYQLSMTLFFEPNECERYSSWSNEFETLEKWAENSKETEGYTTGKNAKPIKFEMGFEQC